jgi:hypothetical protein
VGAGTETKSFCGARTKLAFGYKLDITGTHEARASGRFKDRRSELARDGGEHLKGIDKSNRRKEIIERADGYCEACGKYIAFTGEWHHIVGGLGKKDNLSNATYLCHDCHTGKSGKHVQPHLHSIPGIPDNSR